MGLINVSFFFSFKCSLHENNIDFHLISRKCYLFFSVNSFSVAYIYPFLQNFASEPNVFVSVKYTRSTKPNDAMYLWLENVNSGGFEVCLREFLPFDGKHQDAVVVREVLCSSN